MTILFMAIDVAEVTPGEFKIFEAQHPPECGGSTIPKLLKLAQKALTVHFPNETVIFPSAGLLANYLVESNNNHNYSANTALGVALFNKAALYVLLAANGLSRYIPTTYVVTPSTSTTLPINDINRGDYLFKPAGLAKGQGITDLKKCTNIGAHFPHP